MVFLRKKVEVLNFSFYSANYLHDPLINCEVAKAFNCRAIANFSARIVIHYAVVLSNEVYGMVVINVAVVNVSVRTRDVKEKLVVIVMD